MAKRAPRRGRDRCAGRNPRPTRVAAKCCASVSSASSASSSRAGRWTPIASGRARSLLAWLAYHPGLHPRTRVAAVFWPDVLDSSARASLRTTLATLRRELGEAAAACLVAERERVGIDDGPGLWVDVREIDRLAAAGRRRGGARAVPRRAAGRPRRRLGAGGARGASRPRRRRCSQRSARRPRQGATSTPRWPRAPPARARPVVGGRRARAHPAARASGRPRGGGRGLRGVRGRACGASSAWRRRPRRARSSSEPARRAPPRCDRRRCRCRRRSRAARTPRWSAAPSRSRGCGRLAPGERGRAAVVTVEGEAGSGKTRLLAELAAEARRRGRDRARRALPARTAPVAFAPFTEALRHMSAARPGRCPRGWPASSPACCPSSSPDAAAPRASRRTPATACSRPSPRRSARPPAARRCCSSSRTCTGPTRATLRMLAHVLRTLGVGAAARGRLAARRGRGATPRCSDLLADLRRERRLERVALGGLSESETGALAGAWLGAPAAARARHGRSTRRTGGNPLFVEELVRHLVESHPGAGRRAARRRGGAEVPAGRPRGDRPPARAPRRAGRPRGAARGGRRRGLRARRRRRRLRAERRARSPRRSTAAVARRARRRARRRRAASASRTRCPRGGAGRAERHAARAAAPADGRGARGAPRTARAPTAGAGAAPARRPPARGRAARPRAPRCAPPSSAMRALAYEDAAELLERGARRRARRARTAARRAAARASATRARASGDAPAARRCFERGRRAGARARRRRAARARGARRAGLTVTIGPVRAPRCGRCSRRRSPPSPTDSAAAPAAARAAGDRALLRAARRRCASGLSAEALAAGRRTGGRALLEALGARHVALWSPAHTEERLAIADELVAAAQRGGRPRGGAPGRQLARRRPVRARRARRRTRSIDDHERLAEELRLPGLRLVRPDVAGDARPAGESARGGAAALRGGRAHRPRARTTRTPRCSSRCSGNGIDGAAGRMPTEDGRRAMRAARRAARPRGGAWRRGARAAGRSLDGRRTGVARAARAARWRRWPRRRSTRTGSTRPRASALLGAHLGDAARGRASSTRGCCPTAHRDRDGRPRRAYCTGSASLALGLLAATLGDRAGGGGASRGGGRAATTRSAPSPTPPPRGRRSPACSATGARAALRREADEVAARGRDGCLDACSGV